MYYSVLSEIILIADLLAPTVPSEPKPINKHYLVFGATKVS